MADVIAAATGIGLAFKYLTDALKATDIAASKGGGSTALKDALAALQNHLLKAQTDALAQFEENERLREKCGELRERLEVREKLQVHNNMYWLGPREDNKGPYCVGCFDKDEMLRQMLTEGRVCYCMGCGIVLTVEGKTPTPGERARVAANLPQFRNDRGGGGSRPFRREA